MNRQGVRRKSGGMSAHQAQPQIAMTPAWMRQIAAKPRQPAVSSAATIPPKP